MKLIRYDSIDETLRDDTEGPQWIDLTLDDTYIDREKISNAGSARRWGSVNRRETSCVADPSGTAASLYPKGSICEFVTWSFHRLQSRPMR